MTRTPALVSVAFSVVLASLADAQRTVRVDIGTNGAPANANCGGFPSISDDGRFAVFTSAATNLVPDDTNGAGDVFLHDRFTGETLRVSVATSGEQANGDSASSHTRAISSDGRRIVFTSEATNLVPGDTNRRVDVFVRDVRRGLTRRVSESASGAEGNGYSRVATLSADGRFVAFQSEATNLVPGDGNRADDIFVRDLETGSIERVSVDSAGHEGDEDSYGPSLSADGRFVAFTSESANLVSGDENRSEDVFVHDRLTGSTTLVSRGLGGAAGYGPSLWPSISADGSKIAFLSWANDLVESDTNGFADVFVHDRAAGRTEIASVSTRGQQGYSSPYYPVAISASGRFVSFSSKSANLAHPVSGYAYEVYLRDITADRTTRESVSTAGEQGDGYSLRSSLSADGRFVLFESAATQLVEGDAGYVVDVFLRDRGSLQATLFCGSEQFGTSCPCANAGGAARGCDNSDRSYGAYLTDFGDARVSDDALVIVASDGIAGGRAVLVQGDAEVDPVVYGDGLRCLRSNMKRLYSKVATAGRSVAAPGEGDLPITARSASLGDPIAAGTTRYYQLLYRDSGPGRCGTSVSGAWNASSGIAITWAP